jgi:hypothetical protein
MAIKLDQSQAAGSKEFTFAMLSTWEKIPESMPSGWNGGMLEEQAEINTRYNSQQMSALSL